MIENKQSPYVNSVFEQPWWLETVAPGQWEELFYKENDKIIARLAIVKKRNSLFMPEYTQNIGIWIDPKIKKSDKSFGVQKNIYKHFAKELSKYKTFRITLNQANQYYLPFLWKDFTIHPSASYRISDLENLEFIYNNLSKSLKRNISSAKKKVKVIEEDKIDILIELVRKTFALQNRKISDTEAQLIKDIYKAAKANNAGKLLLAVDEQGNYHSGALFVYDKNVMYYLIPGSNPEFRKSRANSLVIWEGIKEAAKTSKVFDFEGSSIESIEEFFRRFGADFSVFYTIEKNNIFQHVFNFYRRKIKRLAGYKQ